LGYMLILTGMGGKEKRISMLMKQGWILTDLECPSCGSPLLKKDDRYFCAVCDRDVKVVDTFDEYVDELEREVRNTLRYRLVNEMRSILSKEELSREDLTLLESLIRILNLAREPSRGNGD